MASRPARQSCSVIFCSGCFGAPVFWRQKFFCSNCVCLFSAYRTGSSLEMLDKSVLLWLENEQMASQCLLMGCKECCVESSMQVFASRFWWTSVLMKERKILNHRFVFQNKNLCVLPLEFYLLLVCSSVFSSLEAEWPGPKSSEAHRRCLALSFGIFHTYVFIYLDHKKSACFVLFVGCIPFCT